MASTITEETLELKIKENVVGVHFIKVTDLSDGCGAKFEIEVVANAFEGKPLLEQHRFVAKSSQFTNELINTILVRMIHKAIEEERKIIHALTLKTRAPPKA